MATQPKDDDDTGEYKRPDAVEAKKIFDSEIKPKNAHMQTIKGDLADPHKRIKDDCHFPRGVLNFITSLDDMEESKRDHNLLALHDGLAAWGLHLPSDLVTQAQGKDGGSAIPTAERKRPELLAVEGGKSGAKPGTGAAAIEKMNAGKPADDFEEATEEELAQQEGRGGADAGKESEAD